MADSESKMFMPEKWIQHAMKHKGAATVKAKRENLSVEEWAEKHKDDPGIDGQQARLAQTLHHIDKHEATEAEQAPPAGGMRSFH